MKFDKIDAGVQKMLDKAEELGWSIDNVDEDNYEFSKYSPAGQDFSFLVETENEPGAFVQNIYATYDDFDVSHEAYLWLDEDGHGKNGAPYDMKDLYGDMEACQDMIYELYQALNEML